MNEPSKLPANSEGTLLHAQPIRELFEEISETTCVRLALGIDALASVITVAEDDLDREMPLRDWYPVLEVIRRQLQEAKNRLEGLSNVAQLVTK